MLIGGYAVNAFGYIRNTVNVDVWIAREAENRHKAIAALREFGFSNAKEDLFDSPDAMVRMGVPPLRIEVLQSISGVSFEGCWERRIQFDFEGLSIPLISLEDLKQNKLAAGRPKDLVDLSELGD